MPEFILDTGDSESRKQFAALDEFTQGYVECMFWLAKDESNQDENGNPDEFPDWDFSMLSNSALAKIIADCEAFQDANAALLERACAVESEDYTISRAGHDFFLTRNHHGAGFWDRGLGEVGDELTKNAHPYGETNLYIGDDGKLYLE